MASPVIKIQHRTKACGVGFFISCARCTGLKSNWQKAVFKVPTLLVVAHCAWEECLRGCASQQPAAIAASMGKDIIMITLIALIRGFLLQQPHKSSCFLFSGLSSGVYCSPGSCAGPGWGLIKVYPCFLTPVNTEPLHYTNTKLLWAPVGLV